VHVSATQLRLAAPGDVLSDALSAPVETRRQLREHALAVKASHPDETAITLLADDAVPLGRIVRVLDALRHRRELDEIGLPKKLFADVTLGSTPADPADVPQP